MKQSLLEVKTIPHSVFTNTIVHERTSLFSHSRVTLIANASMQWINHFINIYVHLTGMGSLLMHLIMLSLCGYPMEVFGGPHVPGQKSSPHPSASFSVSVDLCFCKSVCVLPVCWEQSSVLWGGFTGCEHRLHLNGTMPLSHQSPPFSHANSANSNQCRQYQPFW